MLSITSKNDFNKFVISESRIPTIKLKCPLIINIVIFLRRRDQDESVRETKILNENLQHIVKSIEEISDEQREIIKRFKLEMDDFVTERTLESCIKTLNSSMQLANVREQLLAIYKQYISILESELKLALKEKEN